MMIMKIETKGARKDVTVAKLVGHTPRSGIRLRVMWVQIVLDICVKMVGKS